MQHGDSEPGQGLESFGRADGNGERPGTGRSIRPGTAVPRTVLVSDMGDGSLLFEAWRDGPSAYLSPADAVPFRRQLAAAFGSPHLASSGGKSEAR